MTTDPLSPSVWEELVAASNDGTLSKPRGTLLAGKPAQEDRRSSRHNVSEDRRSCEIKIGEEVYPARLSNESAEGLAVVVCCPARPDSGQLVQLHADTEWVPLRVVYAVRVPPPKDESGEQDASPYFQLGCSRRCRRSFFSWLFRR
jgi:hypothetical protein